MEQLHHVRALGIGGQQAFVGKHVHAPGSPARRLRQQMLRLMRKQLSSVAPSALQPEVEVFGHLNWCQWPQVETVTYAVAYLAQLRGLEQLLQLRLPEHHDFEQFVMRGLQVGKQPDLLQRQRRH